MKTKSVPKLASFIGAFLLSGVLVASAMSARAQSASNLTEPTQVQTEWIMPADVALVANPARVQKNGKVEVVEFFWYGCSHCADFEPEFAQWRALQSKDVQVLSVPVSWNAMMLVHQRMYFTLAELNRLDLHEQVFTDVANADDYLSSPESVLAWAVAHGIDSALWNATFQSAAVNKQIKQAQKHFERFELTGVPAVIVNGRYQIIASPNRIATLDALVKRSLSKAK